jgi:hypothetical protein
MRQIKAYFQKNSRLQRFIKYLNETQSPWHLIRSNPDPHLSEYNGLQAANEQKYIYNATVVSQRQISVETYIQFSSIRAPFRTLDAETQRFHSW